MQIIVGERADSRQCEALRKIILGEDMELKDTCGQFSGVIR